MSYAQSTEELFSLPGLRFGIDGTDDIGGVYDFSILYRNDTIYDGSKFLIYQQREGLNYYVKVEGRKVYKPLYDLQSQNQSVLCDFGLDVGDSFNSTFGYYLGELKVVEKTIVQYNDGRDRIKLVLENIEYNRLYSWIEGVGLENIGLFVDVNHQKDIRCISSADGDIFLDEGFSPEDCAARACLQLFGNFIIDSTFENRIFIKNSSQFYSEVEMKMGDGTIFDEIISDYEYEDHGCYTIELTAMNTCGDTSYRRRFFDYCGDPIWQKKSDLRIFIVNMFTADEGIGVRSDSLFRTDDGGDSWEYISSDLPIDQDGAIFYAFHIQNDGYGIVLVLSDENGYDAYTTDDGGVTWQGTTVVGTVIRRTDINENGIIVATDYNELYITYDLGGNWTKLDYWAPFQIQQLEMNEDNIIYLVDYFESNEGITSSRFSISKDLGATWDHHIFDEYITRAQVLDADTWLVAGENDLYRTLDGGVTWTSIYDYYGPEQFIKHLKFQDTLTGFASTRTELLRTEDGGSTWRVENCVTRGVPSRITHVEGTSFVSINGILHVREPDPDYECETVSVNEHNFRTIRVFPNPASNYLTITLEDLTKQDEMFVKIYNITGDEVLNEPLHEVSNVLNLDNIPSGIYFYKIIKNQNEIDQGRLVILR